MITLKEALVIHQLTINKFGGSYGVTNNISGKSPAHRQFANR